MKTIRKIGEVPNYQKKAETPLYENKAETKPIANKAAPAPKIGVEVIKAYDGIEVGTIITNPDNQLKGYMIAKGYWK